MWNTLCRKSMWLLRTHAAITDTQTMHITKLWDSNISQMLYFKIFWYEPFNINKTACFERCETPQKGLLDCNNLFLYLIWSTHITVLQHLYWEWCECTTSICELNHAKYTSVYLEANSHEIHSWNMVIQTVNLRLTFFYCTKTNVYLKIRPFVDFTLLRQFEIISNSLHPQFVSN